MVVLVHYPVQSHDVSWSSITLANVSQGESEKLLSTEKTFIDVLCSSLNRKMSSCSHKIATNAASTLIASASARPAYTSNNNPETS